MLPLYQQADNSIKIMRKRSSRTVPLSAPVHTGIIHTCITHSLKIKKKGDEEDDFTDSNTSSPRKGLTFARNQRFTRTKLR